MKINIDPKKFYGYQILGVLIIWLGMTFFLKDITGSGKLIYYVVTSWLLFLIVVTLKNIFSTNKDKHQD